MRKVILNFICLISLNNYFCQNILTDSVPKYTPYGILDNYYDNYGNHYFLNDLRINSPNKNPDYNGQDKSILLCQSGYFDLYFEEGSGMEDISNPTHNERRNVICQVFSDVSNFIISPITSNGLGTRVNILVKNIVDIVPDIANSSIAGIASSFYNMPYNNTPLFGGIADNEIWKTINSGVDSYSTINSPLINSGGSLGNFFHGVVAINFSSISWNLIMDNITTYGSSDLDLYSVALHEVAHALGFASLINYDGGSKFQNSTFFQYYSRYDLFLKDKNNVELLTNDDACSSMYNYQFNPALAPNPTLTPNCSTVPPTTNDLTNNTDCNTAIKYVGSNTVKVYTSGCFELSSLSHFEDQCYPIGTPYGNDQYFCMSSAQLYGPDYDITTTNFNKRYLKPEERGVLCDLRYSTAANFGHHIRSNDFSYGSPCINDNVIGLNDGIAPDASYIYTLNIGESLMISNFLQNDYISNGDTKTFECPEDVFDPTAIISNITPNDFIFSSIVPGLHLIRYIPKSLNNNQLVGNITYIYVYVLNSNCVPSSCQMITNSGFEDYQYTSIPANPAYPILTLDYHANVNCWYDINTTDLLSRDNAFLPYYNGGGNYLEPWQTSYNDNILHMGSVHGVTWGGYYVTEGTFTQLNLPLVNGTYLFRMRAKHKFNEPFSASMFPMIGQISIGGSENLLSTSSSFLFTPSIAPIVLLKDILINTSTNYNDNDWTFYEVEFTYNGPPLNYFYVLNTSGFINEPTFQNFLVIDDLLLEPINTTTVIDLPEILCQNQPISNLGLFITQGVPDGVFTGNGVEFANGVYSFDPSLAGAGEHEINYTYTNNQGCTFIIADYITVVNDQAINPIITSSPVGDLCSGQSTTLTITGTDSFVWEDDNSTLTPRTVTPLSTTTYSVTGTQTNGCESTSSLTITVNDLPEITISASSSNICDGDPVTLTASGNSTSYVWGNGFGTENSISDNPNTNTTYTVTGYLGSCTADASVEVVVENCACMPTSGDVVLGNISTTAIYSNQTILVNQNIEIQANATFTNCEIRVAPNVLILITNRKTSFIGCHLYACSDMWQGIEVTGKANIEFLPIYASNGTTVTKTTLVEDAEKAVKVYDYQNYNSPSLVLKANKTTFNKNFINIEINDFQPNSATEPSAYFDISDNIFTCRNINFTPGTFVWPLSSQVRGSSGTTDALSPQYIPSGTYGAIGSATLKAPRNGQTTNKGIVLNNVGLLLGSFPSYSHTKIIIGNSGTNTFNLFDNMNVGIYCNNSNLICKSNVFQNMFGKGLFKAGIYMESTIGNTQTNRRNFLQIESSTGNLPLNRFYNCTYAVWGKSLWTVKIDNIWVRNDFTNATARHGIFINTAFYRQIAIEKSSFYNTHNAIMINHINTDGDVEYSLLGNNVHTNQVNGSISIKKNRFEDNFTNANVPLRQLRNAIVVNNLSGLNGYSFAGTNITIDENKMTDVFRGILVSGWLKQLFIQNNEAKLVQETGSTQQYGIANLNNSGNFFNGFNKIDNNIIEGYNFTDNNNLQSAIYSSMSRNQLVTCNYVSNSYHGIKFDFNNSGTRFELNNMENHFYGFTLDQTGIIGTQGLNGTNPYKTDNKWSGSWTGLHAKSATLNSTASLSKIYVRNNPLDYVPSGITNQSAGDEYSIIASTILSPNNIDNNLLDCNPDHGNPNSNGGGNGNGNGTGVLTGGSGSVLLLEQIALNQLIYTHNPEQTQLINEHKLFQLLEQEPDLRVNSSVLETFYQDNLTSNKGKVRKAENYLANGNLVLATNEVNNIVDDNEVDYNYKTYYDWYLNQTWDSLPHASDSTYLFDLANSCPFTKGSVVYQARALYQSIYNYSEAFVDNCENKRGGTNFGKHDITDGKDIKIEENKQFSIYPNPNNGEFHITVSKLSNPNQLFEIFDMSGKLVYVENIQFENGSIKLIRNLESGIYVFKLTDEENNEQILKKVTINSK